TTRRGGASLGSAFFAFAPLLGLAAPLPLAAAFGFAAGFALLWARGLAAVFGFASDLASVFFAGALRVARFLRGAFFGAALFVCVSFFSSATTTPSPGPCRRRSGPGRSAWGRTRRACGRPSTRRCRRARAFGRRGRRWCAPPSRGRSSSAATRS